MALEMTGDAEKFAEEARSFLAACLAASPQQRFQSLFERQNVEAGGDLWRALSESRDDFAPDLARVQLELGAPEQLFERLLLAPTLLAVYLYRLSHALFVRDVKLGPDVVSALSRWMTGAEIYYSAEIGPGFKLIHGLGTVIGARCRAGSHFTMYQGATLGDKLGKQTGLDARPVIGDYVIVSAGASVLGPVTVGSKTVIGANAVVLDSLPGRCVAAGIPARVKVEDLSDAAFEEFWSSIRG